MKKVLLLITIIFTVFAFILTESDEPVTSTSSMLVVNEKGHSNDYDEY